MNLHEIMIKRRSVRNFKDQKIPENVINELLDAVNNAPSGGTYNQFLSLLYKSLRQGKNWHHYLTLSINLDKIPHGR